MQVTAEMIKELRDMTGAGIMECKKALTESEGNVQKAIEYLQKKSLAKAVKRMSRVAKEGIVGSYIHGEGKIGVLVEINCETDFVARTDDYRTFVKDIAMHIAAMSPLYLDQNSIPEGDLAKQKEIFSAQARESGKPENIIDKIAEGKMKKWYTEVCLLDQAFVKDPEKTISTVVTDVTGKTGEKVNIRRYVRFQLGEGIAEESAPEAEA